MATDPLAEIRAFPVDDKDENESIREYIRRLGEQANVPSEVTEGAADYVTAWYFSSEPPNTQDDFKTFLDELSSTVGKPETSQSEAWEYDSAPEYTTGGWNPAIEKHASIEVDTHHLGFKGGLRGTDARGLLLRFVAIVAISPLIGWLLGRAWVPSNRFYEIERRLVTESFGIGPEYALEMPALFALGIYLSLVLLLLVDVKKRVQGMLLLVGTGFALGVQASMGRFLPHIDFAVPVVTGSLLLGMLVGVVLGGGPLRHLDLDRSTFSQPKTGSDEFPEFKAAAWLLFGLVATVVTASFVQVIVAETAQVWDAVASGGLLLLLFQFVQYESESTYMTLGPERSGKSMMMLGFLLELNRKPGPHPNPNDYLKQMLERASNLQPETERWPVPSTSPDEIHTATFEVLAGSLFPRRLEMTALDYAGQHLGRIASIFEGDETNSSESELNVPRRIATRLESADALLFILDVERLEYPTLFQDADTEGASVSWGFEHYGTILEHIDVDDVYVVATKCDILVDQGHVNAPFEYDSFEEFKTAVSTYLSDRPDVTELLQLTGATDIQPVYFVTHRPQDTYVPSLDADGNMVPVGYDYLINTLKEEG